MSVQLIDGNFVVRGHKDVSLVLRGQGWSSDPKRDPAAPAEVHQIPDSILIFMDAPEHNRLRRLLYPMFTPSSVEHHRPLVAAIVDAALEGIDADGKAEIDIYSEYADIISLSVVAEILGVGPRGAELFHDLIPDLVKILEIGATSEEYSVSNDAAVEIAMFLAPLIAERKVAPGADYISAMLMHGVTVDEIMTTCTQLLTAGHETTANAITNSVHELLKHPDQIDNLYGNTPYALEELFRVAGPLRIVKRIALVDHRLGETAVPAGSTVILDIHSANTDASRYADGARLDLTRKPSGHLSFSGGVHHCLGAPLARVIVSEALVRLFRAYPDASLACTELRWRTEPSIFGLCELPVRIR